LILPEICPKRKKAHWCRRRSR